MRRPWSPPRVLWRRAHRAMALYSQSLPRYCLCPRPRTLDFRTVALFASADEGDEAGDATGCVPGRTAQTRWSLFVHHVCPTEARRARDSDQRVRGVCQSFRQSTHRSRAASGHRRQRADRDDQWKPWVWGRGLHRTRQRARVAAQRTTQPTLGTFACRPRCDGVACHSGPLSESTAPV